MISLSMFVAAIDNQDNCEKFAALYESYEKLVMKITFNYLKDFHYAEEAAQSAFFALARNIEKIDLSETDKTRIYVCKCAKSAAFDILRKLERAPKMVSIDEFHSISAEDNAESLLEDREALDALIAIIESMPDIYRDVLTYRYLSGFTVGEIADMLHTTKKTVRNLFYRGNKLLKRAVVRGESYE